jgi:hypothetical protein
MLQAEHYLLTILFYFPTGPLDSQLVFPLSVSQPKSCMHLSYRHMSRHLILHDLSPQEHASSTNYNAPQYTIIFIACCTPLLRHQNQVVLRAGYTHNAPLPHFTKVNTWNARCSIPWSSCNISFHTSLIQIQANVENVKVPMFWPNV